MAVLFEIGHLPAQSMVFQIDSVVVLVSDLATLFPVLLLLDIGGCEQNIIDRGLLDRFLDDLSGSFCTFYLILSGIPGSSG